MKCEKCAKCCIEKTVSISLEDINRINKITNQTYYRIRVTKATVLNWKSYKDYHICIFLNGDTKLCEIYNDRPAVCKKFYCSR